MSRQLTYAPHYEGSSILFGPPGGVSSAHGTHTFKAQPGHHLPSRRLSSRRNVFEELGAGFSLLAFDAGDVTAFERAAQTLAIPLKIIRDTFGDERAAYEARLVLVRPDRYVAWVGDHLPSSAADVLKRATGR
jgi:hypothetical protein